MSERPECKPLCWQQRAPTDAVALCHAATAGSSLLVPRTGLRLLSLCCATFGSQCRGHCQDPHHDGAAVSKQKLLPPQCQLQPAPTEPNQTKHPQQGSAAAPAHRAARPSLSFLLRPGAEQGRASEDPGFWRPMEAFSTRYFPPSLLPAQTPALRAPAAFELKPKL